MHSFRESLRKALTLNRLVFVLSAGLSSGLLIAILLNCFAGWHFKLLESGDYPGFYAVALLASEQSPELYSEAVQSWIQQSTFPDREGYYFTVYPAMTAALLIPLSWVSPEVGKALLSALMLVAALLGVFVTRATRKRLSRGLGDGEDQIHCDAQKAFLSLGLFESMAVFSAPLFLGLICAQNSSVSFLLAALFLGAIVRVTSAGKVVQSAGSREQISLGIIAGLWCFKPQYGLLAIAFLIGARLYGAILVSALIAISYYLIGVGVLGWRWPLIWAEAASRFALPNLEANGHQMTSLLAFLHHLVVNSGGGQTTIEMLVHLSFPIACLWAIFCGITWRRIAKDARKIRERRFGLALSFVAGIPLLAPQTLFYDLSISFAATLSVVSRSSQRARIMLGVVVASYLLFYFRSAGALPLFPLLAAVLVLDARHFGLVGTSKD